MNTFEHRRDAENALVALNYSDLKPALIMRGQDMIKILAMSKLSSYHDRHVEEIAGQNLSSSQEKEGLQILCNVVYNNFEQPRSLGWHRPVGSSMQQSSKRLKKNKIKKNLNF